MTHQNITGGLPVLTPWESQQAFHTNHLKFSAKRAAIVYQIESNVHAESVICSSAMFLTNVHAQSIVVNLVNNNRPDLVM